ncbi:MAG: hypothetical protein OMM_02339 [Candidatus Magnetoglobus multicellularis str. Araruama]|uniref:LVIVD repeat-containing protein n=1 Tax=Candidatus Magnetoglobus multicellularis str. Araruama TaxID=890399 RepID=A0A1V1PA60_9BACT|nr:MAG: hypothetical protein OMM_02339 [Candidatus Magnetoglobus multicellularis str. Araruama]
MNKAMLIFNIICMFLPFTIDVYANELNLVSIEPSDIKVGEQASITITGTGLSEIDSLILYPVDPFKRIIGKFHTECNIYEILVRDNIAYLGNGECGLALVNIENLSSPKLIAAIDTPGCASGICIVDNLIYIADRTGGLQIVEFQYPSHLEMIGSISTRGEAEKIEIQGEYAYIADDNNSLQVIRISEPAKPQLVATNDIHRLGIDIELKNNVAYVTNFLYSLQVISIEEPDSPITVKIIEPMVISPYGFCPEQMKIKDDFLFMTSNLFGEYGSFYSLDIHNPLNPKIIGELPDTPGEDITIYENKAYITLYSDIKTIDISNPAKPHLIEVISLRGHARAINVSDNIIYVGTKELLILSNSFVLPILNKENMSIKTKLPEIRMPGQYALKVFQEDQSVEMVNAIHLRCVKGDINGDDLVDLTDAIIVMKKLSH